MDVAGAGSNGEVDMNRWLLGLVVVAGLLTATNPARPDFNSWAQNYVAKKMEEEAVKRGQDPNDGSSQLGGVIAGFVIANMPIERQNYLAFSIYTIEFPGENGEKSCSIIGVAGQFLPLGAC